MTDENLWGTLPESGKLQLPVTILKQQAIMLNKLTRGLLDGKVMSITGGATELGSICHEFRIVAPAMGNFSTPIVVIGHSITLYPVNIYRNIEKTFVKTIPTEEAFKKVLVDVFQSDEVRKIIGALMAQSTAE